ncbi:hypothetical protein ACFQZI_04090 [Mucilaginibacter lutimaris]|uniref:Uncharacterized protein n=1 Tax=Mucilaginibacter lutimaris TaxID=931629 RepID=A0ABW2ZCV5_9SPHI
MKKTLLVLLITISLSQLKAFAQYGTNSQTPITDALGRPVATRDFIKFKGSPFLYDEWVKGEITTNDGQVYKDLLLKFDLTHNLLTFTYNKDDEPQRFKDPVRVFTMYAETVRVFANGFPKTDGLNKDTYYEVIAAGKTLLLKHHRPILKTVRDENRAPVVGQYTETQYYYIFKNDKINKIKRNQQAIAAALADKADQVSTYLNTHKTNFDSDADLKKLFDYYNSL